MLLSISYFSFAQGVSLSITDAEIGTIDIETTTGSITNEHISCCEPFVLDITLNNNNAEDANLYLAFRYFAVNQMYDFTDCGVCSIEFISDNNSDCDPDNSMVVIDEIIPGGAPPQPNPYKWKVKVPFYNASDGNLQILYRNDQGNIVSTNLFIYSESANCPTDVSKITELTQTGCQEYGWPSPSEMCAGTQYMDNLRPQTDVIIDINEYCFLGSSGNNVDFNFGPGKQLIVEEGNKLTLDYCHFYTCYGKMWKGIYLEKGAELVMTNSTIEDAEFAITFEKGAKLTLEDNEFTDNYVHMKALSVRIVEDTGDETEISSFKNNEFTGSGSLASTYDGQTTNPQEYPYAGILIGDGSAGWRTCGTLRFTTDNVTERNKFSYLANGILNQRDGGNLFLKGSTFNEINSTTGAGYATSGFGIKHETLLRSSIINGFDSWPEGYSFSNVDIALRSNLAAIIKFDKQVVDQCTRGVFSTKTISSSYINNNTFSTSWNSVEVANSNIRTDFEILDNTIDLDISTLIVKEKGGIILTNVNCQGNEYDKTSLIKGNNINARYAQTGIGLFDVENLFIKENSVDLARDITDIYGLEVMGGQKLSVGCNSILGHYGEAGVNDKSTGILIFSASTDSEFTCNDLEKTDIGIHVFHTNTRTDLKGNEFITHSKGIEYGSTAEPLASSGPQEYHGNIWSTSYNPSQNHFGALHNSTDPNFVEMSRYVVNDNQGAQYNTEDYPSYFVSEQYLKPNFLCSSLSNCAPDTVFSLDSWDKLDSAALTDTGSIIIYDDNVLRDLQWQVYRSMLKGSIAYSSTYDNIAQTLSIDALYQSGNELKDVLNLLSFSTFPDTILSSGSVDTLSDNQHTQMYEELSNGYDTMMIELESFIASEGWSTGTEDTYLGYHSLALEKEAELWESDNGYIDAFEIPMCSFEGGEAWSKLNALQPSDDIQYLLDFGCVTFRESEPNAREKEYSIVLSPNPAQHALFISNTDKLEDEKRNYAIIDMNGTTVQSGIVNKGKVELKPNIQSGIYFFSLNQQTIKFVLIR